MPDEKCRCALGAFGYADNTDRIKFFLPDARKSANTRRFIATVIVDELINRDISRLKECNIDVSKLEEKARLVQYTLKKEDKPLSLVEADTITTALDDMDGYLLRQLRECARE